MKRSTKLFVLATVLLVGGITSSLYVYGSTGDVPTVTVDGKVVPLVEARYFGKMNETEKLDNLIKDKKITPIVVNDNSSFNVHFGSLDGKSYTLIEGDDHGWISNRMINGTTMEAKCPTGHDGKPDKEWLVKVCNDLQYGKKVYEFVLKTE